MQTLLQLLEFLQPYGSHSYVVMLAILILCGFGLPLPEDVVLITGGILASHGVTDFWGVVGICMIGVLVGDGTIFMLGRNFGPSIRNKSFFRKILSPERDQKVQEIIQKYGKKVVFMARFMPGLRTPIFFTCGSYRVSPWRFLMLDGLAAILSVPAWVYVGFVFGQNLEELEHRMRQFQFGTYALLAALVGVFVFTAWRKKNKKAPSPAS